MCFNVFSKETKVLEQNVCLWSPSVFSSSLKWLIKTLMNGWNTAIILRTVLTSNIISSNSVDRIKKLNGLWFAHVCSRCVFKLVDCRLRSKAFSPELKNSDTVSTQYHFNWSWSHWNLLIFNWRKWFNLHFLPQGKHYTPILNRNRSYSIVCSSS